jgi:hypothetical protein
MNYDKHNMLEKRVNDAVLASGQKIVCVCYSAYDLDDDDEPIDNLDEIAAKGKVILVGFADDYWGGNESKDYRSEVLENPTWLQVAVCANAMIKTTKDTHHCFLEGLEKHSEEDNVTVYEMSMGS